MQTKKLTLAEIRAHAGTIVAGLLDIRAVDGVRVLCAALDLVVERSDTEFPGSIKSGNVNFLPRKSGRMLKIDRDLTMKTFILGLTEPMSIKELREKLVEEFGAKRAPSENTLFKYFKRHRQGGEK
jgi:hypothetical protein